MSDMDESSQPASEPIAYETVSGPEELWNKLVTMLEVSQMDPTFINKDHFILYTLGGQRSMIKVEMTKHPFEFWYCDAQGRPPTKAVKETIARFLWEKCGQQEKFGERI